MASDSAASDDGHGGPSPQASPAPGTQRGSGIRGQGSEGVGLVGLPNGSIALIAELTSENLNLSEENGRLMKANKQLAERCVCIGVCFLHVSNALSLPVRQPKASPLRWSSYHTACNFGSVSLVIGR